MVVALSWTFWSTFQFALKFEENLEQLDLSYQNHYDILKDCSNVLQSTEFIQKCKESKVYVSKPLKLRAFLETLSAIGLCGVDNCWDHIFGPEFTWQGKVVQVLFVSGILWAVFMILKTGKLFINKRRNKYKKPQIMYVKDDTNRLSRQSDQRSDTQILQIN